MPDHDDEDRDARRRRRATTMAGGHYAVGYGKPPEHRRFKPGNPGRPKGTKNKLKLEGLNRTFAAKFIATREQTVVITDKGRRTKVTWSNLIDKAFMTNCAKGNTASQKIYYEISERSERIVQHEREDRIRIVYDYKHDAGDEIIQRNGLGLSASDVLPHPDHVHYDAVRDAVRFSGPIDLRDKEGQDRLHGSLRDCETELQMLGAEIAAAEDDDERGLFEADARNIGVRVALLRWTLGGGDEGFRPTAGEIAAKAVQLRRAFSLPARR